jgi:hypothetical protein
MITYYDKKNINCDVGYPMQPKQNIQPDSNKHIEYALFHLVTQNYIYNSDEGGLGFNGNEPFLIHDNDWHCHFGEDQFDNEEEKLYLFTNDGTYPIEEFEIHEYQCSLAGIKDVISKPIKNPDNIKHNMLIMNQNSSRFAISAEQEIVDIKDGVVSFKQEIDDLLNDMIY